MFASIVSRSVTLEVLSTGVAGNYNGALQVVCIYIYMIDWYNYMVGNSNSNSNVVAL